ncbi:UNVERIFIED_CONTAM: hypothetical protein GTU68_009272 [Idotea baltica]|nr:hypothetical protein [Idotea baltica]
MVSIVSLDADEQEKDLNLPDQLPILALKNTVLFPGVVVPITIGRNKSLKAIKEANKTEDKWIFVISQRDDMLEDPEIDDLYKIGTIAKIVKMLKMPNGGTTAILQGKTRGELSSVIHDTPYILGQVARLAVEAPADKMHFKAQISSIKDLAKRIIELSPQIPAEAIMMLKNITSDSFLLNFIASNLQAKTEIKQSILEMFNLGQQADEILKNMNSELQLLEIKDQIDHKVRGDIDKQQRDYFLNQQLRTIQNELGQNPQSEELEELALRARDKKWPDAIRKVFEKQHQKVKRSNPQSPEYSVLLNYLEILLDLPWGKYSKDNFDLKHVRKVFNQDHFGLEKVKTRIIEHLAVLKLKGDLKAPIICLVGPPGVGKTSLGRSVARALGREFIRMSFGGLHDESEIRGHRRTYIGAMPGRIIQNIKKAGTDNPVFILDEIDKIGKDFRGDPSSALLEVLDPEQNGTFHDNFLDVEYDLSKVLFIATANSLSTIQPALRDRMEIIHVSGYSVEEKIEIAKKHLVPKQRKAHGLKGSQVSLSPKVLKHIIGHYTRESGVRSLERQLASVMRNTASKVALEERFNNKLSSEDITKILGVNRFSNDSYSVQKVPGVAVGLAWTPVGGDILFIEASHHTGKGKLTLTGNLGDVMKESATTALTYLKAHADEVGIDSSWFSEHDIHIHVPEGAIPKDGPSAGVTMLSALASTILEKPVKSYLAMSGEITLRGKVLPVGGIKEKILAAKRSGLKHIMLCEENKKHVDEIDKDYIKNVKFQYVADMSEVLHVALGLKV